MHLIRSGPEPDRSALPWTRTMPYRVTSANGVNPTSPSSATSKACGQRQRRQLPDLLILRPNRHYWIVASVDPQPTITRGVPTSTPRVLIKWLRQDSCGFSESVVAIER